MAEYVTLNDAMVANDELGEAVLRFQLLSEAFHDLPQMRSQLNAQIERCKAEILRLRAVKPKSDASNSEVGRVVAFDAGRFRKSG